MAELRSAGERQTDLEISPIAQKAVPSAVRTKALAAILHAGEIARHHFASDLESWEKSPGQTVTKADLEIDDYLRRTLPQSGDGWLSEETADSPDRLDKDRVWIVDPIDGTRSFAYGNPEFAISIALTERGRAIGGWLLNPISQELLEAYRGHGAYLGGTRVHVNAQTPLIDADVVVSSGERRTTNLASVLAPAEVRPLGSLAYKLMHVATGKADAYVTFRKISDWDLAAGILAVSEAGGRVTDCQGEPHILNKAKPRHHGIVAASNDLHAELVEKTQSSA